VARNVIYIPTDAFRLLKILRQFFSQHGIIFADFNALPGALPGINGPIVQKTVGNTTIENVSYLQAAIGSFDIFFPTNFANLKVLFDAINTNRGISSQFCTTKKFMKQNAELKYTRTMTGYNPLLSDYSNTSFFLTDIPRSTGKNDEKL